MRIKSIVSYFCVLITFACQLFWPFFSVSAFSPHYIISDAEFTDNYAMTAKEIQSFLKNRGSFLAGYLPRDRNGDIRSSANIIATAAHTHRINPRVLLVLLQKEQSLIEGEVPTPRRLNWAVGYGVCDNCKTNDPYLKKFKGFAQQIEYAAERLRYFLDHPNGMSIKTGEPTKIDNQMVTPLNIATAALYIYTPHIHGNFNFWKIWSRWFARNYPNGSILQDRLSGGVWWITEGVRRPIKSKSALTSRFNLNQIITVDKEELEKYPVGLPVTLPAFTLIRSPRGTVYLLTLTGKRGITSKNVLTQLGYSPEEMILNVGWDELKLYPDEEPITEKSVFPTGVLLENTNTKEMYLVKDGLRHPILDRSILFNRFPRAHLTSTIDNILKQYPIGPPLTYIDGTLIKIAKDPNVYVIEKGQRRRIANEKVFEFMHYKWNKIITTTPELLALNPEGAPIDIAVEETK